jgi:hypothetical protein
MIEGAGAAVAGVAWDGAMERDGPNEGGGPSPPPAGGSNCCAAAGKSVQTSAKASQQISPAKPPATRMPPDLTTQPTPEASPMVWFLTGIAANSSHYRGGPP